MWEFPGGPREGNVNPLQYSCLENLMDKEALWATVHGVAQSQTRLSNSHTFLVVQWLGLGTFITLCPGLIPG